VRGELGLAPRYCNARLQGCSIGTKRGSESVAFSPWGCADSVYTRSRFSLFRGPEN